MRSLSSLSMVALLGLLSAGFFFAAPDPALAAESVIDKLLELAKEKQKLEPKPDDHELRKLSIQRFNVAVDELAARCDDFKKNLTSQDKVFQAAQDLLTAELALQEKPEDRAAVLEKSIEILKWYEGKQEKSLKDGVGLRADLYRAQYVRLSLEIELVKVKKEMKAK